MQPPHGKNRSDYRRYSFDTGDGFLCPYVHVHINHLYFTIFPPSCQQETKWRLARKRVKEKACLREVSRKAATSFAMQNIAVAPVGWRKEPAQTLKYRARSFTRSPSVASRQLPPGGSLFVSFRTEYQSPFLTLRRGGTCSSRNGHPKPTVKPKPRAHRPTVGRCSSRSRKRFVRTGKGCLEEIVKVVGLVGAR